MSELKPCPFCDGSPLLNAGPYDWDCGGRYYYSASIECACGLTLEVDNPGPKVYTDDEEALGFAIDAWNTRAERTCTNTKMDGSYFRCSRCHATFDMLDDEGEPVIWWNDSPQFNSYCPHCGAKVVEQ